MSDEELSQKSQSTDIEHLQELIRPIRELSAVWNIPLSEYLDSYLQSLADININNDFTPDMLNFSQAGLFLQGSTNVLAKKVKHLYDLATSTVSFDTLEGGDKSQGKRKRKNDPLDYIIDDKLAPIEDPDVLSSAPTLAEKTQRQDITTMPKVPLCLLSSIDSQTTSENTSFRVNLVPNERYSIILLDPTINVDELPEPELYDENAGDLPNPYEADKADQTEGNINTEKTNEQDNQNDKNDNEQMQPPPLPDVRGNEEEDVGDQVLPPLPENEHEEEEEEDLKIVLLDPDSTKLTKFLKPMKKMKKFRIPKSFNEKAENTKVAKKHFNDGIFLEMFDEIKSLRKEKNPKEQQYNPFEALSKEEGREHILNDLDSYQDEDLPVPDIGLPDEEPINYDNNVDYTLTPPHYSTPTLASSGITYYDLCKSFISKMVESGERRVHKTEQNQVLSSWEKKIGPKLENDLKRPAFKIDECEEWTIDMLKSHKGSILFAELTADLENHEISRVFLAVLVLANKERVRIDENASKGTNFNIFLNE